jgi:hypothetical protein
MTCPRQCVSERSGAKREPRGSQPASLSDEAMPLSHGPGPIQQRLSHWLAAAVNLQQV